MLSIRGVVVSDPRRFPPTPPTVTSTFEFLKRSSSKSSDKGNKSSERSDNKLRGMSFEEQNKAIDPKPDKKDNGPKAATGKELERQEDVLADAHEIGNQDVILEQLAHRGAYGAIPGEIGNAMDHTRFPLARLAAARGMMIPGVTGKGGEGPEDRLTRVVKSDSEEEKSGWFSRFAEGSRKFFGDLVRDESMETYVQVWREIEDMCKTGIFSESYVHGVIDANDKLKEEQKIKMHDQVKILYANLPKTKDKKKA